MGKMILGTVQLGMPYGVNNTKGKPDMKEAMQILDYAYQNGVNILDTASSYGGSEEVIGNYMKQNTAGPAFKICTKLPVNIEKRCVLDCYEESKQKLNIERFYVYYLHRFEQCKNSDVVRQLIRLRETGRIGNIGVSVYEPCELEYIVEHLSDIIDVVQIPFNVADNIRWTKDELLARAKVRGIKLYARSIFLQGLILSDADSELAGKMGIAGWIVRLQDIARSLKRQVAQLAVDYISTVGEIKRYLIGCETTDQIKENIKFSKNAVKLENDVCEEIEKISRGMDEKIIDPRRWQ